MVEGGRSGTKAAMEVRKPDDSQRQPNKISRESAAKPEKDFGETFLFHFSACRSLFEQIALLRKSVPTLTVLFYDRAIRFGFARSTSPV